MRGVCGKRRDGDSLNCPDNGPAGPPDTELSSLLEITCPTLWAQHGAQGTYCCTSEQVRDIAESTQKVAPFVVGCPACYRNFVDFWCQASCSSDQASFSNVTAVIQASSNNATVVSEIDYWIKESFGVKLFDSCKDVKFGAANLPAMSFIGGGASNYSEWLVFLGLVKDKRPIPIGSPFQLNFIKSGSGDGRPEGFSGALDGSLVSCGDNALRCSCSDCPESSGCPLPDADDPDDESSGECKLGAISCFDLIVILVWVGLLAGVITMYRQRISFNQEDAASLIDGAGEEEGKEQMESSRHFVQGILRRAFYHLGLFSGTNPSLVITASIFISGLFCLGLIRMRVESDPQRLWVGPGSQASMDKAAYEESFGSFYRITQVTQYSGLIYILLNPNLVGELEGVAGCSCSKRLLEGPLSGILLTLPALLGLGHIVAFIILASPVVNPLGGHEGGELDLMREQGQPTAL